MPNIGQSAEPVAEVPPEANASRVDDIALRRIQKQLAQLSERVVAFEEDDTVNSTAVAAVDTSPDQYAEARSVVDSFQAANNSSTSSEEWFWTESGAGEKSLVFAEADGFGVKAVVCRSDWCRVEIEDTSVNGRDNLISDLELQLRINESLGRDTVIRSGQRNGRQRVLFIQ